MKSFQKKSVSIHGTVPEGGSAFDWDVLEDSVLVASWHPPVLFDFDGSSLALLPALQAASNQMFAWAYHSTPSLPSQIHPFKHSLFVDWTQNL